MLRRWLRKLLAYRQFYINHFTIAGIMQVIPNKSLFSALISLLHSTKHLHLGFKVNMLLQNSSPARWYYVCPFRI